MNSLFDRRHQCFPWPLIFKKNFIDMHNYILGILLVFWWTQQGLPGQCISERFSEICQRLLSKKALPTSYDLTRVQSAQLFLSFFFFSSSQGLMKVCEYFDPISPPRFVSGPGGGTVVNASWLTDSHVPDSGSDWWSPCSSHMASEYSSLRPFLVPSPTVPFCCTKHWEWVPSFVSCF